MFAPSSTVQHAQPSAPPSPGDNLSVRCGFEFEYATPEPTPAVFVLKPRSGPGQHIEQEIFTFKPRIPAREAHDMHGNVLHSVLLPAGNTSVRADLLVAVPAVPENSGLPDGEMPIHTLPADVQRYTLPSRYCDSDRMLDFAYQQFGRTQPGIARVRAICDWIHQNVEYRWGAGSPYFTANDTLTGRFGVCRDFAHLAVSLCRAMNLPARYVTGFLPDIAFQDPGTPMDFHAYFQVWLGGAWHTYDARFNSQRIGRIHIAAGLDAVDVAFSTIYGPAKLVHFHVWSYQVDADATRVGDPVDLTKRLDGTPELRLA